MKKIKSLKEGDQVYIKMPKNVNQGLVAIVEVIKVIRSNGLSCFIGLFNEIQNHDIQSKKYLFMMKDILDWQKIKYY